MNNPVNLENNKHSFFRAISFKKNTFERSLQTYPFFANYQLLLEAYFNIYKKKFSL